MKEELAAATLLVHFFSKKFSPSQRKYSAYDCELTAIYEAAKYFCRIFHSIQMRIHESYVSFGDFFFLL